MCSIITLDTAARHVNITYQKPNINITPGLIWLLYFISWLLWLWLCGEENAPVVTPVELHLPFFQPRPELMWHCSNHVQGSLFVESNSLQFTWELNEQKVLSHQNTLGALWETDLHSWNGLKGGCSSSVSHWIRWRLDRWLLWCCHFMCTAQRFQGWLEV